MTTRRALELFSGIGGFAEAAAGELEVVAAVDHDRLAQQVYGANFEHRQEVKNLAAVKAPWLASFDADVWWMSPPCAPHSVRGNQRDTDDRRASAFLRLMELLPLVRPRAVLLENVPWFAGSRAHARFREATEAAGLCHREEREICPTELGVPGVRRRFYAVASADPLSVGPAPRQRLALRDFVDLGDDRESLRIPPDVVARFGGAFHRVDPLDADAVAACFTRAYARSPVYAGSYLVAPSGLRYFSPEEIACLHGHRRGFSFAGLPEASAFKLVGNGLSVPAARFVLSWLPQGS